MFGKRGIQPAGALPSVSAARPTNGDRPSIPPARPDTGKERAATVRWAVSLLAIALTLILVDWLSREKWPTLPDLDTRGISGITLSVNSRQLPSNGKALAIQFRLSNRGKHSINYPLCKTRDTPAGDIFYRTFETSAWTLLSEDSRADTAILPKCAASNLAWIEMPPGGWVDGEFLDPGGSKGDHAFGIQIRTRQDTATTLKLSDPYRTSK